MRLLKYYLLNSRIALESISILLIILIAAVSIKSKVKVEHVDLYGALYMIRLKRLGYVT